MDKDRNGYGAATLSSLDMFEDCSRGTGRTDRMIRFVESGDAVVVLNAATARDIRRRLADQEIEAKVLVCRPNLGALADRLRGCNADIHFEHEWELQYYRAQIEDIRNSMVEFKDVFKRREEPDKMRTDYLGPAIV